MMNDTVSILIGIAGFMRSFGEHTAFRNSRDWSVLYGTWFLKSDGILNLDGYHVFRFLMYAMIFLAGHNFDFYDNMFYNFYSLVLYSLFFYSVYEIFYHYVFTPEKNRDLSVGQWLQAVITISLILILS